MGTKVAEGDVVVGRAFQMGCQELKVIFIAVGNGIGR